MNFKYFKINALVALVVILSIPFTLFLDCLANSLENYPTAVQIYKFIEPLSNLGLVSLTLVFINKIGWKWTIFKWLIYLPNLNGRYEGVLNSSYNSKGIDRVLKLNKLHRMHTSLFIRCINLKPLLVYSLI
jgi:hypothetical protein